jgi:hypothetical protein
MKSKDIIAQEKIKLASNMAEAIKTGDEAKMAAAFTDFAAAVQEGVIADAHEMAAAQTHDAAVLAGRGVRQLTTAENKYYTELAKAISSSDPKAALTNFEVTMPQTIIDMVIGDIKREHPLLAKITFTNTFGRIKMLVNAQGAQTAIWGKITSAITEQLSGAFREIDATLYKLTAYMPVSKDLLELGPQWLDAYVREVLAEASAVGLETGIVSGTGKDQPIGMDRDVSETAAVTNGVYPQMTAIAVTDLSAVTMGGLCAQIARDPLNENGARPVSNLVMLVNPLDYYGKVMPATTFLLPTGAYAKDVLPVECEIIQSVAVTSGQAVFGMAKKYFLAVGTSKDGKIEYDDSVHFLEDERVYIVKLHANGFPMDAYAFLLLDISGLNPINQTVTVAEVKGVVKTKEQA